MRLHLSLTTLYTLDLTHQPKERAIRKGGASIGAVPDVRVYELRQPTEPELRKLAALGGTTTYDLRSRLRHGSRCVVLCDGPNLATYCWTSYHRERIGESECDIVLRPGMAYIWDCATLPRFRGRGYYPRVLRWIVTALREQGISRVWVAAAWSNWPSRRGIAKAGFEHVASILHLCIGPWRSYRVLPVASASSEALKLAHAIVQPIRPWGAEPAELAEVVQIGRTR